MNITMEGLNLKKEKVQGFYKKFDIFYRSEKRIVSNSFNREIKRARKLVAWFALFLRGKIGHG